MNRRESKFVETVWEFYRAHGRHSLPWRKTRNPYRILVSEIMLQQTQVERVVSKYWEFLRTFPSARRLVAAPLGQVLRAWQGLGYNRRAKLLHECAAVVTAKHSGRFPKTRAALEALPGIGPYTAGAVLAFAYNEPAVLIETNVRTVYLRHFFKNKSDVRDADILKLVASTCDQDNPREWYYALMDYGAHLKRAEGNVNRRSAHYTRQSKFAGSDRQIRGAIVRALAEGERPESALIRTLPFDQERITTQLTALEKEGMIECYKTRYRLPR